MLVSTDARIWNRAVRLVELVSWDVRKIRPERFGRGEIECAVFARKARAFSCSLTLPR